MSPLNDDSTPESGAGKWTWCAMLPDVYLGLIIVSVCRVGFFCYYSIFRRFIYIYTV